MKQDEIEGILVQDSRALSEVTRHMAAADVIALDTEFVRERTYFPQLCLLQVATDNVVAAVDCLAEVDLEPFFTTLLAPDKTWLLHSARQDLEVLFNRTGQLPARLIDTQIAASLLGMPMQIGLQGLLRETLGIEIGKEHTRADWSRRPLPDAVIGYALDDVRFLLPAWQVLRERLAGMGRLGWLEEDCDRLLNLPIAPDTATLLERTKGTGSLRGRARAAAYALIAWRETRARERDKPRRWILADDQLIRIAAAAPDDLDALRAVSDLPPRLVGRSGKALVEAIANAEPVAEPANQAPPDKSAVSQLQAEVRKRAEGLGIQPEVLATRRDIVEVVAGRRPSAFTSGWRAAELSDLAAAVS
jgi:ribonuclease D